MLRGVGRLGSWLEGGLSAQCVWLTGGRFLSGLGLQEGHRGHFSSGSRGARRSRQPQGAAPHLPWSLCLQRPREGVRADGRFSCESPRGTRCRPGEGGRRGARAQGCGPDRGERRAPEHLEASWEDTVNGPEREYCKTSAAVGNRVWFGPSLEDQLVLGLQVTETPTNSS